MEKYVLKNDVTTLGEEVKSFPHGVGDAYHELIKILPDGDKRSYYGIFEMKDGAMHYYAAAEEKHAGEAEEYNCDRYTIGKGEYLTEKITDWRDNTDCIKDVFEKLGQDSRVDHSKPGVEWYKNDKEMWCMLRVKV